MNIKKGFVSLVIVCLLLALTSSSAFAYNWTRTLKVGDSGADVVELQIRIAGWAADSEQQTYVAVDGYFGTQTEAAVKRFQRAYGLTVDGIVGPQTQSVLNSLEDSDGSTVNFSWNEFRCNGFEQGLGCCDGFSNGKVGSSTVRENVRRLMWKLEALRKKSGNNSVTITSGFRCVTYNSRIGGTSNSQHMYGIAADIRVSNRTATQTNSVARTCGFSGIYSIDSTTVHVDSRIEYPYGAQFWWWQW